MAIYIQSLLIYFITEQIYLLFYQYLWYLLLLSHTALRNKSKDWYAHNQDDRHVYLQTVVSVS